jgi:hypothetical protein
MPAANPLPYTLALVRARSTKLEHQPKRAWPSHEKVRTPTMNDEQGDIGEFAELLASTENRVYFFEGVLNGGINMGSPMSSEVVYDEDGVLTNTMLVRVYNMEVQIQVIGGRVIYESESETTAS